MVKAQLRDLVLLIRNFVEVFGHSSTTRSFVCAKMPVAKLKRKVLAEDETAVGDVVEEITVSKESSGQLKKITIEACICWY